MTCLRCGRTNPEGARFCASCGNALAGDPESQALADNPTLTTGPFPASGSRGGRSGPSIQLPPGARLGTRYEIVSLLGQGGMGAVYKAHDRELDRTVALKVIRSEMAAQPDVLERFKREILLASKVTHKNVLRIHDLGEAGDLKFISMNYVEGANLKTLLQREGPLPLERALPLIHQICEALQAAHEAGIVHRDLKPQNILIDGDGNAYIADFGISRSLESGGTMTETGAILGTVDYMSPEQARGETPDHRGDIYSLGVILYEIFTGNLPFESPNALSVMMKRIHEDAPAIRRSRPENPAWLSAIVARALKRDVAARYQSVGEVLRDLDRQRASIAWRRLLLRAAAPTVLLVVLLAGAGYYLFRLARAPGPGARQTTVPMQAVAFLPFENATGNPALDWTRTGFATLVSKNLDEAQEIRVLGGDRTHQTLEDLKLPLTGTYTPFDLKRAASVLGADVLVTGVVRRAGNLFQAEARLQRPDRQGMQNIAVERAEGRGEESIFSLADTLASKIAGVLKVRSSQRSGSRRMTTRSVEALRLYSEGLELARSGRDSDATKRLEEAVGKDPTFALAHALLSQTYDRQGQRDRALSSSDQAMKNLGAVSDHEARLIRARHALLEGHPDQGIAEYKGLLQSHPQDADAHFELAGILEQKGDLTGAAAELEKGTSLDPKHSSALYSLGRIRLKQGDNEAALKIFSDLLAVYTQSGNDEGMGTVLHALGSLRMQTGQSDDALRYYRQALDIRTKIQDNRGMAVTLEGISLVQRNKGKYAEAIRTSRQALDLRTRIGDPRGIASGWMNLGETYEMAGQIQDARNCYQDSLRIVRDLEDPALLAQNVSSLGYVSSVLGNYSEAYLFYQEALAKRRQIGNKRALLRSLVEMGLIEQIQGRYDKALSFAAESAGIVREIGEKAAGAAVSTNVGMIHDDQASYAAAIKSLTEAVESARAVGDKDLLASALLYLGETLAHLGNLTGAEKQLGEAESLIKEISSTPLLPELLIFRAEVEGAHGQTDRCLKTLEEALRRARSLGDRRLIILTRLNLGRWSLAAGRPAGRSHLVWATEEAGKAALLPLRVRALSYLAFLGSDGAPNSGVTAAEQVLKEGKPLELRESLVVASWVLARHAAVKGDQAEAKRLFLQAGELLEEMVEGLEEPYRSALLGRGDISKLREEALAYISRHGSPSEKEVAATSLFARPQPSKKP